MYTVFIVLIVIVSILLLLIVLVQNPKGGGLASTFASSNQFMGVRRTTDFLEKATWTLAILLVVFSVLASLTIPRQEKKENNSMIEEKIQDIPESGQVPKFPTQVPQQNQQQNPAGNQGQNK
jgi:preprotein translocase subunit SecG